MDRITNERVVGVAGPIESSAIVSASASLGVSWGALFAGALVSIGVWFLLHTLGMGIGLVAVDPDAPRSMRGFGIGTGIWSMVAPLVGLFIGGMVAGRNSGALTRISAVIHGGVLWSMVTVAALLLMATMIEALAGGVSQVVSPEMGARVSDDEAVEATGRVMLGMFFVLLLGAASAILGAVLAENRNVKRMTTGPVYSAPSPRPT